ncbi:MAG: hypothetical protein SF123_10910 [Chloroflexota bacterium]|nr:hypothetical protein [Chloroflexota bacterium]
MYVSQITIKRGVTLNLGNYENARHEVAMTVALDQGEDVALAAEDLTAQVNEQLARVVAPTLEHGVDDSRWLTTFSSK